MIEKGCLYRTSVRCDLGTREEQQDRYCLCSDREQLLAVVCDGMGGTDGGAQASELAVRMIENQFRKDLSGEENFTSILHSIPQIDHTIYSMRDTSGERLKAGTTLVMALLEKNMLRWLSIGDSRLYLLRENEMLRVTQDHNYAWLLDTKRKQNLISEKEYQRELERGEALVSFLGIGDMRIADISAKPICLHERDRLLLVSDGLYKLLSDAEIEAILGNFKDTDMATQALLSKAKRRAAKGTQDNTTMILIEYVFDGGKEYAGSKVFE